MLEIRHLAFSYAKGEDILHDISFSARPGEITVVIGANGVGKTTMLKSIAGIHKCRGEITVCGKKQEEYSMQELANCTSYLSQNTYCDANLNVYEIILLGLIGQLSFRVSEDDLKKVDAVMELMNISKFAHRQISELSGGQRQLVFIAQTLIKDPKVLIMDEPTSALDLNKQFKLMNFIRKVTKEKNFTTLMTLHHLDLTARYADRVVVLHGGRVYSEGTPDEIFTSKMLKEVYEVEAEIYKDKQGFGHIISLDMI